MNAPTRAGCVHRPASAGQVNALIPSTVATGQQQLTLNTSAGTSAAVTLTVNIAAPGLLAPPNFRVNGTQYAVALFADGTYVLPTAAISGLTSQPAKPGDEIVLYGAGFGPVTPTIPAGQLAQRPPAWRISRYPLAECLARSSMTGWHRITPDFTSSTLQFHPSRRAISRPPPQPLSEMRAWSLLLTILWPSRQIQSHDKS